MTIFSTMAQHIDVVSDSLHYASLSASHAVHGLGAADGAHASQIAGQASGDLIILAQNAAPAAPATGADFAERVKNVAQEEQLGWLSTIGRHFIGVFQQGGQVFTGFVTGIIPTLIVLMTAFYAVTEIVGEQRVHGLARAAGRIALTRYTVLPVMAMFFLTNPMAYTFGTFLEEKHKPAFYDSAVSFCHPITGLFPHANAGEYFVWGGVLVALQQLESSGKLPAGWHVNLAVWYFIVGVVVILIRGIVTEKITQIMARREGVKL
ncbi:PTS glucitol/sorbitol transporter subunit IIC [Microvirga guangxiensis]|uniref:PTS system, glucitol/sorbitol-specific IIC component n=1 Tax=Microvirga guangxiensis TaxID=549386 RepID=A0A1G5E4H8_9HYPH|nr:PTS glucitol/sorbitol transporter subunit IIC [Microvirga guangxiensis]SCY21859.1 PTS system, glucitol/sorbitol-specific IIC component [Microvirga guangxiensis]